MDYQNCKARPLDYKELGMYCISKKLKTLHLPIIICIVFMLNSVPFPLLRNNRKNPEAKVIHITYCDMLKTIPLAERKSDLPIFLWCK
jgi:hypothetical protein